MELTQAISEIVERYGLDAIFQPRIRSYLLDYGVSDSSASLFIILLKNPDFCTIIRNNRSVDDWGSKIDALAESTMLQPTFIKTIIEELLRIELDIDVSGGSEKVRVQGTLETDDFVYEGQMVDGHPDGHGVMTFKKNGTNYKNGIYKYEGEMKFLGDFSYWNGEGTVTVTHGTFKCRFKKGNICPGDVMVDCWLPTTHVKGVVNLKEEMTDIYKIVSLFLDHGKGTLESCKPDGSVFEGQFKQGKLFNGVFSQKNMKGFYADVKDGVYSPMYKLLPNGNKIVGKIVYGKYKGICTITYPNGDYYEGNIEDDLRSGVGTYHFRNGIVFRAVWSRNECYSPFEVFINGVCYWGKLKGTIFEGKENKMFGKKITADIKFQP